MQTLIDPFELVPAFVPPPARPPMPTMSIDVDFGEELAHALPQPAPSSHDSFGSIHGDPAPDSWSRVRCWCSED